MRQVYTNNFVTLIPSQQDFKPNQTDLFEPKLHDTPITTQHFTKRIIPDRLIDLFHSKNSVSLLINCSSNENIRQNYNVLRFKRSDLGFLLDAIKRGIAELRTRIAN